MYGALRRYRVSPDISDEIIQLILEDLAPQVRSIQGCINYNIVDSGDGEVLSISIFENKEGVQKSSALAYKWMGANLAKFIPRGEHAPNLRVEEVIEGSCYGEVSRPNYEQALQEARAASHDVPTKSSNTQDLQLFSVEELCELLGVGKSWVYKRLKNGEIPSVRVGRAFRVRHEDLNEYLTKRHYNY